MSLTPETVIEKTLARLNARTQNIREHKHVLFTPDDFHRFNALFFSQTYGVYRDMCLYFLNQSEDGQQAMKDFSGDPAPQAAAARAERKIKLDKNYQLVYGQLCEDLGVDPSLLSQVYTPEPEEVRVKKTPSPERKIEQKKEKRKTSEKSEVQRTKSQKHKAVHSSVHLTSDFKESIHTIPTFTYNPDKIIEAFMDAYNKVYKPLVDLDKYDLDEMSNPKFTLAREIVTTLLDSLSPQEDKELRENNIRLYIRFRNNGEIDHVKHNFICRLSEGDEQAVNVILGTCRTLNVPGRAQVKILENFRFKKNESPTDQPSP